MYLGIASVSATSFSRGISTSPTNWRRESSRICRVSVSRIMCAPLGPEVGRCSTVHRHPEGLPSGGADVVNHVDQARPDIVSELVPWKLEARSTAVEGQ